MDRSATGCKMDRMILDCGDRCWVSRVLAVSGDKACKDNRASFRALRGEQAEGALLDLVAVALAAAVAVGSEVGAAVVGSAVREAGSAGQEGMEDSSAIEGIAAARASTATRRSSGRALTPMPSLSH